MNWAGSAGGALDWAVAARPIAGQQVSGDQHLIAPFPGGVLVAVVDALGHGPGAEATARAAITVLAQAPAYRVETLVARCDQALGRLRGAVMSLASFDLAGSTMSWIGVGNVEGLLVGAAVRERLLVWGGLVGQAVGRPRPATLPVRPGDTLLLVTDGVRSSFVDGLRTEDPVESIAGRVLAQYATGKDDALVLAARFRGIAA